MPAGGNRALCFGHYVLDLNRGCLRREEREISLRPKSFAVLRYLVENAGRLVSKDELGTAIWPSVVVSDESLARCVSDVRLALEDSRQFTIKTVPRRGYLFAAPVSPATESVPPIQRPGEAPPSRAPRLSLVVLPFTNLGGDAAQDHFIDALTDNLTTDLSHLPGAFVISRSTALTFKGKAVDARRIGRTLNVRYVIEGSVLSGTDRLHLNAQLIDADTGAHLWAERFDKRRADIFEMLSEIGARLARALGIEIIAAESRRVGREPPGKVDASGLSLRGWAILNRPGSLGRAREARRFFEDALTLDESHVDALLGLASSHLYEAGNFLSDRAPEQIQIAQAALSKALSLAPDNAAAHNIYAILLGTLGEPERGLRECEMAIALDPNLASAHARAGLMKLYLGRAEETEAHVAKAISLSPRDPELRLWHLFMGSADLLLGRLDRAAEHFQRSSEVDPDFELPYFYLAAALALAGRDAEAAQACAIGRRLTPSFTIAKVTGRPRSNNPTFLAQSACCYEGMRKAGVPER